tara:strand:- start:60 stop:314 length:255 start_codon:yes stop_codon:yes gene_type:complete
MEKPKEYKIETLKDLCDVVNSENIGTLSHDLVLWLKHYNEAIIEVRKLLPEKVKDFKNSEIAEGSFLWIDDNEAGLRGVNIEIK